MLAGSVGQGGINKPVEVKIAQVILNNWLGDQRLPLLKVDGIAGPLTIGAIKSFQKTHGTGSDGRLDPAGRTLATLVGLQLAQAQAALVQTHNGRQLKAMASNATSEVAPALAAIAALRTILTTL